MHNTRGKKELARCIAAFLCMDRFRSSEWCTPGGEAGKLAGHGNGIKYHICTFLTY
jgi:hypothetical protein